MAVQFTDENFDNEVLESSKIKPFLVDFFASWCGPCKLQGPIVDELSDDMGEKAFIGKMDTESNNATAAKFGIMSIPTLLIFKNGEVVEKLVGLQDKESLKQTIEKYI
jgi:thioredoxin 1